MTNNCANPRVQTVIHALGVSVGVSGADRRQSCCPLGGPREEISELRSEVRDEFPRPRDRGHRAFRVVRRSGAEWEDGI